MSSYVDNEDQLILFFIEALTFSRRFFQIKHPPHAFDSNLGLTKTLIQFLRGIPKYKRYSIENHFEKT